VNIPRLFTVIVFAAMLLTACGVPPTPAADIAIEEPAAESEQQVSEEQASDSADEAAVSGDLDPACLGKDVAFAAFADQLNIFCDDVYMYIEADNLADHEKMVGITAWNQQVPIPQDFHEDNAWRIPLYPVMASSPTPTTGEGPVAVAINGVMVYNPTQQDGVYDTSRDPYLIGELDHCGGHSGRADDYHYHIAPVCLLDELAEYANGGLPISYALDGYPIYGFVEGMDLDECRGAPDSAGNYSYYASEDYPYVNGCFSGEVDLSLQPATHPIRPPGEPIQVLITALYEDSDGWNHLEYDYQGGTHSVNYRMDAEGCYEFEYVDGDSVGETASYCANNEPPPAP
jgi:hypothetical protein